MPSASLLRRALLPVLVALTCGLGARLMVRLGGLTVAQMQLAVADRVMLRSPGPQWGRLQASDQLVLVLFDSKSAQNMNRLPTAAEDLEIYERLLEAGAVSVADTRMLALATPQGMSESAGMLKRMAELSEGGHLVRDVWMANAESDLLQHVAPIVSHNPLNMHVNPHAFLEPRLYPLLTGDNFGMQETMPLQLARRARGLPAPQPEEVVEEMLRCGIMADERAMAAGEAPEMLPYELHGLRIPWVPTPSKSSLVPPAAFWISYRGSPSDLKRVSYWDVLDAETSSEVFRGKTVLIGFEAEVDPSADTFPVPSGASRVSAAEVVGCAVQTLLDERTFRSFPSSVRVAVSLLLCLAVSLAAGLLRPAAAAAAVLSLLTAYLVGAVVAQRADWRSDLLVVPVAASLAAVLSGGCRYWAEVRWRTRVVDLFGRYVPRAVVSQLVLKPDAEALAVGGETREVTVLFADVRGFTTFAEQRAPEAVLQRLNQLLQVMVDCTFANEGTVDKFIGDAILVLFNAPLAQPDHVERAVRTAWMIQQQLAGQSDDLTIGIGIHRGEAVVGTIGTPQRMEYTAIGATVNLASRLCDSAGPGEIVVSSEVADGLQGFVVEAREPVRAKGLAQPLVTARVTGERS